MIGGSYQEQWDMDIVIGMDEEFFKMSTIGGMFSMMMWF